MLPDLEKVRMTGKDTFPGTNFKVRTSFESTEVPEPVRNVVDFDGLYIHRSKGYYGTAGEKK